MELQATMALDRDAVNTVLLRLLPPSTAATSSTSWLLLHTIPITASLSRTLSRLVSLEQAVVTAEARSGQTSASRRVNGSRPSSSSPSSSGATSLNGSFAAAAASAAAASPPPPGCIDVVRVGYILSEIHAYCLLLKCRSAAQAARMKAALEEGAALGVTAPVEFVSEAGVVAVTRRSFAEPCEQQHSNNSSTASACGDAREADTLQQHQSSTANHQSGVGRQGQQWHCEVHATTLLDAVTAIYPVRDGAEESTADDEDDSDCRGDGGEDGYGRRRGERRTSDGGRLDRSAHRSQLHSPHPQAMRRPHSDQAMSAPASPSMQQQQHWRSPPPPSNSVLSPATPTMVAAGPRARGSVAKGAAPGAARPPLTLPSPPAQTGARAHTPLHLPQPCAESGGASPLKLDVVTVGRASSSSAPRQRQEPQRSGGGNTRGSSGGRVVGGDPYDEFCAICLVDPLRTGACVTTLCQHVFHLHCYAQLPSSSAECPLCRFSVYDLLNDARCEVCGTYEDLWVCLVCGNVACGRARRDHQQEHYRSSGHSCSWQSSTNRIWNLSSRMFLHQEVALLLDGAEDSSHDEGSAMERLRCMSWAEPLDEDLQEALKESKEEAVAHYYTQFLQQLAEEQRRYYETRQAEQRVRRERRQWQLEAQSHSTFGAKPADEEKEFASSSCATVHGIVREERQQRRRILAEYAPAMVGLLQEAQRAYTVMYNSLKATRDDAQQQVLLRSHFNSGLTAQADQLRQRTQDAVRKGQRNAQVKVAEEAAMQKKVEDALAAL